ncbi:LysR substrate-binding domain-containing protein [Embleya sp. NPDC005575]|uniref:LysR substrate-binding domain-containing protein n=1 Tax=Embleya sp. NPDC005575 TaxID=3156892 RepID=UPI0033A8BECA
MDVRLLRALVMVADCGGFGVAAGRLSITQPALTKRIQALEAEVGGALFVRGRQGAEPTRLGAALLPEARDLVRRADLLTRRAAQFKRGEAGSLAVGFGLSGIDLAPQAVAAFRRRFPGVRITLEDMSSDAQVEAVRAGDLDVGFVRLPAPDDLGRLVVLTDTLAVAAPGDQDPPPTDPVGVAAWLRGRPVVRLTRAKGPGLVRQIESFEEAFGARPELVQEASDLQTVLALVAAGVGAALVPAGAADIAAPTATVTPIAADDASDTFDAVAWRIGAIWNRTPARATRARDNFLTVVRALVDQRTRDRATATATATSNPPSAQRPDRSPGSSRTQRIATEDQRW